MAKGERLPGGRAKEVRIDFEGESIPAREGEPIAAALLAHGVDIFSRAVKYHRARGPFCLSGRCSHCAMRVDGEPNVLTCVATAAQGTKVERQNAFPSVQHDVFASIDWLYPKGLDHHSLFAGVPLVEKVVAKVARELAGLGTLPQAAQHEDARYLELPADVVVIGGGGAGMAAALAASAKARVVLLEDNAEAGGRLRSGLKLAGDPEDGWAQRQRRALEEAGVKVLCGTAAFGLYREESTLVAARAPGRRLLVVRPRAVVVATGACELLAPFGNNDLPGVFAGRALARLISVDRVVPGSRAVVAGDGPETPALAALLRSAGVEVVAETGLSAGPRGKLVRARGRSQVAGAVIADASGAERKLRCDLIAVADHRSAFGDLARQAGARIEWKGSQGFGVVAHEQGATDVPGIFACGEVTGTCSAAESIRQGEAAGRAAAAFALGATP
jgi:sarcosine oxidase subunit alpha